MSTHQSPEQLASLLRELSKLPKEAEWVEFKHNNDDPQMIGEYISALANSAALLGKQSAYVVWGVADEDHELLGTNFKPSTTRHKQQELENWLGDFRRSFYPFRVEFHHHLTHRVIVLRSTTEPTLLPLSVNQIEDLKLASSKMSGAERRSFQATMTLKYCQGNARLAERVFGWGRETVQLGLNEHRTGFICWGMQSAYGGDKLWEEKHPEVAQALWTLAQAHSQQDPTFRTLLSYTRLTAAEALKQLRNQGFRDDQLPSPSTMAEILNRNGYRLRKVIKAKPQKKLPETDAIFANIKDKDGALLEDEDSVDGGLVKRLSIDCKATINIGDYSRGGKTRGDSRAADHDMGCEEKYVPFGIVDEDKGALYVTFGSSFKTSDFIADSLMGWWENTATHEGAAIAHIQIKVDNGPESSGVRTQFLKRIVEFVDHTRKIVQLLYYPPYHSKYNPIERCWGILEQHWNGAKLVTVETMLEWAKSMTWKGIQPVVSLSKTVYQKGISLSKVAMQAIEARLERNPILPKWDILIRPA